MVCLTKTDHQHGDIVATVQVTTRHGTSCRRMPATSWRAAQAASCRPAPARLRQEVQQLAGGLPRGFFGNEVPDRNRLAADVVGPLPPDRQRVLVDWRDRTSLAPEEQHRAGDLPVAAVFLVLLVVQRR